MKRKTRKATSGRRAWGVGAALPLPVGLVAPLSWQGRRPLSRRRFVATVAALCLFVMAGTVSAQFPITGYAISNGVASSTANGGAYSVYGATGSSYSATTRYNLQFGQGTQNYDRHLGTIQVNGSNFLSVILAVDVSFRRNPSPAIPNVRNLIWGEYDRAENTTNLFLRSSRGTTMEAVFSSDVINRGTDNVFANQGDGSGNNNNIERVDYVLGNEVVIAPSTQDQRDSGGFIVMERGGNDQFKMAAILGLDTNGFPSRYGPMVYQTNVNWSGAGCAAAWTNQTLVMRSDSGMEHTPSALTDATQGAYGWFFSLANLGIALGQRVYGYSLFGPDTTATNTPQMIQWTNSVYFPTNTADASGVVDAGGLDLVAGGLLVLRGGLNTTNLFLSSIGGQIWNDANTNRTNDIGEVDLSNVRVFLDLNNDGVWGINEPFTVTDEAGRYTIASVVAGTYVARVDPGTLPSGAQPTYDRDGTNTPNVAIVTLPLTGQAVTNADFGYYVPVLAAQLGKGASSLVTTRGGTITYSLYPQCTLAGPLSNLWVRDVIPSHTTYVTNSANAGGTYTVASNWVAWSLGSSLGAVTGLVGYVPGSAGVYSNAPSGDTYISSASSGSNYGSSGNLFTQSRSSYLYSLLQFTPSGIPPGVRIDSATLSVYVTSSRGVNVGVYGLLTPWTESSATWSRPSGGSTTWAGGGSFGWAGSFGTNDYLEPAIATFNAGTLGWKTVDVTSWADAWFNGGGGSDGLALLPKAGSDRSVTYASRENAAANQRPYLSVKWSTPTTLGSQTRMDVAPLLVCPAGQVSITMTASVYSNAGNVTVSFPSNLTVSLADGTATVTKISGPLPGGTVTLGVNGSTNATYVYSVVAGTNRASVVFSGMPTSTNTGMTFANASAASVIVAPVLSYRVLVGTNESPKVMSVTNVATFGGGTATGGAFTVTSAPVVSVVLSLESYTDASCTVVTNTYFLRSSDSREIHVGGPGFTPAMGYVVAYYDAAGQLVYVDTSAYADVGGFLRSTDPNTNNAVVCGTWTAVAMAQGVVPQSTLAAQRAQASTIVVDTFEVLAGGGTFGDFAWVDSNGNGVQDSSEPGLSNVLVRLYDASNAVVATVTSSAAGVYAFTNVLPGTYTLGFTPPAGYLFTVSNAGGDDGVDSDPLSGTNRTTTYMLTNGQTNRTIDAGFYLPASIAGSVLVDTNANGAIEAGETNGIIGVTLVLRDAASNVVATVVTGAGGAYSFTNLPPGSYTVVEINAAGVVSTGDAVGLNDDRIPVTVTSGQTLASNYFLDTPSGRIGNSIWLDENGDGVQDAGEVGLANVSVVLYGTNGVALATNVTDSSGEYLFRGLPAGTYTVRVDTNSMAAGLAANPTFDPDGTTNHQTTVVLGAGATVLTADFGYNWAPPPDTRNGTGTGAIGDRVWVDADGDGVQDPGEPGLSNMTVRLYVDVAGNGNYTSLVATATTDAAGNYIFDGLAAGAYVVVVNGGSTPAGYTATGDPDGTFDNRTTTPIILAPGDVYVNADFGYRPASSSTIGDLVYYDGNGNGSFDGSDTGVVGVTVALLDASGKVIATTITATNGFYLFTGLPAGTYTVWVNDTGNRLGRLRETADPDGGNDNRGTLSVDGVTGNLLQDFGYTAQGQTSGSGLIGDTIFLDRDGNTVAGAGEGLAGIGVGLYTTNGVLLALTTTDVNGLYAFGGLSTNNASYVVRVDTNTLPAGVTNSFDPDGGIVSESTVVLSGATPIRLTQDFGYRAAAPNTIAGTIWADVNADGTLGAGEAGRFGGITVTLYGTNGTVVATTVTDGSGNYSFGGLPAGTYRVDVTDDGNRLNGYWHSAGPTPGADNNSQRDPYAVTVSGGQTDSTGDFGYFIEGGAVGNRTWFDDNGNGIQDTGEVGLSNVVVRLRAVYANGTTTEVYTVSGTSGYYSFGNLLLDESFITNGPSYVVSIPTIPMGYYAVPKYAGTNMWVDAGYIGGQPVTAARGVTDVGLRSDPRTEPAQGSYDFGFDNAPTLAVISGFRAFTEGGRTWVGWETAAELGTVGYYLERWTGTNWASVNEDILFVDDAEPLPHVYEVEDAGAVSGGTYTWQIVELDAHNRLIAYGPYTVTVGGAAISYETWAAMHFVDLLAPEAARGVDADGDGLTNFEEYLAGTNPRDRNSVLKVTGVESRPAAGEMVLRWQSEADRTYSVELSTNLAGGFLPFEHGILSTPPSNVHTMQVSSASGALYFRVVTE